MIYLNLSARAAFSSGEGQGVALTLTKLPSRYKQFLPVAHLVSVEVITIMVGGSSSTNGSGGSASAAVAMANSAIENARRAAASSRQSRKSSGYNSSSNLGASSKSSGRYKSSSNLGASKSSGADSSNFDLINNDNAYHVIATLVTDRLLPKLQAHSTYYTLSSDDRAFFQKMLPYSVRRKFVDALRYRLQRMKSRNGRGNDNSALDNLTKQCQMLGLDQEKVNALLDLSNNTGVKYAVSNENQEDIPITSSFENRPYAHANDYTATTQQPSVYDGGNMTSSPMAYPSNNGYASPSVRDMEATAESLARQQIMAEIDETKFLMHGSATPEAKLFWQRHMDELNGRLVSLNMQEQAQSPRGGSGFESGGYDVRPQVESYGFSGNQAANNYYEEDPMPVNSPASPTTLIQGPSCEVVAPSDLPGGYMFEAELPGRKKFVATVPSGGVTKGQKFLSTMKELETIEIPITMGGWNDDVWSCFSAGIFHPLLWNGIFFPCSKFCVSF